MAAMFVLLTRLINDERGVTAVEYGLIAALIAVAAVAVMATVGTNLKGTFSTVGSKLEAPESNDQPQSRHFVLLQCASGFCESRRGRRTDARPRLTKQEGPDRLLRVPITGGQQAVDHLLL